MSQNEVASQIIDSAAPVIDPNGTMPGASTDAVTPGANQTPRDDKISSKLEILIRREAAALHREQSARAKEADIQAKLARIEEFESAKGNSKKALELLGLNYDELTKSVLQDGEMPPEVKIKRVEEKFDRFTEEQRQKDEKAQQLAKAQAEEREKQAITNFKTEIGQHVKDNAARYELIAFEGQEDLIFDVIDEHYNRTMDKESGIGKVMPIAEAADRVEKHLEAKYNNAKSVNKVKTLWGTIPKDMKDQIVKSESKSQSPRTLTNNLSAAPMSKPVRPPEDKRISEIVAKFMATRGQ